MMPDNQMDDLFNKRLGDYPSPVPEDMWERIIQKKDKDRKAFLFFLRLFGILTLAIALAGGYFLLYPVKKDFTSDINTLTDKNKLPLKDSGESNVAPKLRPAQNSATQFEPSVTNQRMAPLKKQRQRYSDKLKDAESNKNAKGDLWQTEKRTESHSTQNDSSEFGNKKAIAQKDSLEKKPIAKSDSGDSAKNTGSKKPADKKTIERGKRSLDLYVSPDIPFTSTPEYNQMKLSYTIGLKLNRSFGDHFSGKLGIQFSQINYIGADSNVFETPGHLMSIDLPAFVGYSFGNEKLRMTLNAGPIFNLYSWFHGDGSPDIFKTNTGISAYLGLNFETKIN